MNWDEYKQVAKSRGALAFECYAVTSLLVAGREMTPDALKEHLAYIGSLEASGALMFAGPMSDDAGENVAGGLLVLKTADLSEAVALMRADPAHRAGIRAFSIRRWLINEGGLQVTFGLGGQRVHIE